MVAGGSLGSSTWPLAGDAVAPGVDFCGAQYQRTRGLEQGLGFDMQFGAQRRGRKKRKKRHGVERTLALFSAAASFAGPLPRGPPAPWSLLRAGPRGDALEHERADVQESDEALGHIMNNVEAVQAGRSVWHL